jgi:hypothetical protein
MSPILTQYEGTFERDPPPQRLYKFLRRYDAEAMCRIGQIRVGTLHEYRDEERYRGQILDREEGFLDYRDTILSARGDQLNPLWHHQLGMALGPNSQVFCCNFSVRTSEPNQFIYCTSLSPEWHAELLNDAERDTCVEITNVRGFIEAMALLFRDVRKRGVEYGNCIYEGREHGAVTFDGKSYGGPPVRAAFLKPADHLPWKEFRIVMDPRKQPIKYLIRRSVRLADCCRIHSSRPAPLS